MSVRRWRIVFLLAALGALAALVLWMALASAQSYQQRGVADGFAQPVRYADSLLIGVNADLDQYDEATLNARFGLLKESGVTYVRQVFRWNEIEQAQGKYDWHKSDLIISTAQRHKIKILAVLFTTPQWARTPSGSPQFPANEFSPPQDMSDFAMFAGAFARRYSSDDSTILAYQIWDEPNLSSAWGNGLINPQAYLRMLRDARTAIRAEDVRSMIVLAGLAPTVERSDVNLAPQEFLSKLYALGARDAFDIVAAKPYGFDFAADDRRVSPDLLNFSHVILMREVMQVNGDSDKAIWLTQFGWNSLPVNWQGEHSVWGNTDEETRARYTAQALKRVANEWNWVGAMFVETLQPNTKANNARWGFALIDAQNRINLTFQTITAFSSLQARDPVIRAQRFANCVEQAETTHAKNFVTQDGARFPLAEFVCDPNPRVNFSAGWRFSELGADIPQREDAKLTFSFTGDALALIVRRDNYRAYTYVTVDGKPANALPHDERGAYLIMTSPDIQPHIEMIEVAHSLGDGTHVAEISVDRGWNQWALIGWSSRPVLAFDATFWRALIAMLTSLSIAAIVVAVPRAQLLALSRTLIARFKKIRATPTRGIIAALLMWLTMSLTWMQDAATAWRNLGLPASLAVSALASSVFVWSPIFVLSLFALSVVFLIVLLRLDIGLMLAAFFIPFFILPQRLFAYAFSMIELVTLMCVISFAIRIVPKLIHSPARALRSLTVLDVGVIAWCAVALVSALTAAYRVEALRELRVVIIESALFYFVLSRAHLTAPQSKSQANRIVLAFVCGASVIALIGLINYARGDVFAAEFGLPRIKSIYGSPNNDALLLDRALPFVLAFVAFGSIARWKKLAAGAIALLMLLAIALSQSRGALLLGVPAALIVMSFLAGGRWRKLSIVGGVLIAVAFGVLLSGAAQSALAGTRFANALDLNRGTGFFRVQLWQSAWNMFLDHSLLGVGPDNFLYAYRGRYILPAAWQEPNLSHPHNFFFDLISRLGAAGLFAFVLIVAGAIRTWRAAWRTADHDARALLIGCAGVWAAIFAHGLVDHSLFNVDLAFIFMLTCGLAVRLSQSRSDII